jgi:protein transport protein SEC24
LAADVERNLSRPTAWEAVMRIRCSRGLRIASFHGHFFNRSTDLLALPTCDPDKSFAVQIAHEETMVGGPVGYVQCALLYTNSNGERRIRCVLVVVFFWFVCCCCVWLVGWGVGAFSNLATC